MRNILRAVWPCAEKNAHTVDVAQARTLSVNAYRRWYLLTRLQAMGGYCFSEGQANACRVHSVARAAAWCATSSALAINP